MQFVSFIDSGGFGRVERVRLPTGVEVARKVFDPAPGLGKLTPEDTAKLVKRFAQEVRMQSQLAQYGAMPVLQHDLNANPPWFTMPLAQKTLKDQIAEDRAAHRVTPQAFADVLNVLEQIHRLGYAHRDLKPSNVLLVNGKWYLADFGLAAALSEGATTRVTSTGSGWETQEYCAPEQHRDFRNAKAPADIYSFGCILHDMFGTKKRTPYHQHDGRPPFASVIRTCTSLDPAKRFKSIEVLRSILLPLLVREAETNIDPTTTAWDSELDNFPIWSVEKMEEFASAARAQAEQSAVQYSLYGSLTSERMNTFHQRSAEVWSDIASGYCDWAAGGTFGFAFCDVIGDVLRTIFALGGVEEKAAAATSAAVLGNSHNRFFVMDVVLTMCGPTMPELVAERIGMEILARELAVSFQRCAEVMNRVITDYHPHITSAIRRALGLAAPERGPLLPWDPR